MRETHALSVQIRWIRGSNTNACMSNSHATTILVVLTKRDINDTYKHKYLVFYYSLSPHDEEKKMLSSDVLYMREIHALSVEIR